MAWTDGIDRAVNFIVTATIWNSLFGATGSLMQLKSHRHDGTVGEGSQSVGPLVLEDFTDAAAPAAPGAGKTRFYSVGGRLRWRAGAAGADTVLPSAHSETTGITPDDHHLQAHTLASHSAKAHADLSGLAADDHAQYATNAEFDDHNARHEPGGADPMAVDAAAGTPSLRSIGTGALQAMAGNTVKGAAVAHGSYTANNAATRAIATGLTTVRFVLMFVTTAPTYLPMILAGGSGDAQNRRILVNAGGSYLFSDQTVVAYLSGANIQLTNGNSPMGGNEGTIAIWHWWAIGE